jgi:uncharacterized SAM-binding protein YcdF (DUF218 family)
MFHNAPLTVLYSPAMKGVFRAILRGFALLLLIALLAFALLAWQIDRLGGRDDAQAADAIVVLGARVNADGSPGSDLTSRTYHAVDLWLAGYAPYIICTGGFKNERFSAAAVCRRFAIELGVPADRIFLADGSTNTIEDAASTAQVMADQGWRKAILVSHPLHLYRARWLFRRIGLDVITSPTSTDMTKIAPPVRAWYAVREAAAIVITAVDGWRVVPQEWIARLQRWTYRLQ